MKNYFFDQRTITFLISLVIAFGLWLLIKLSGDFQTEHNIQLKFQNFPIDKVLINSPDSILNIQTNNNGFGVLGQFVFNRNKSLIVNIENTNYLHTKSGIETYYILGSSLHSLVEDEFKTAEQILDIQPDSIIFKFEKLASKKLKITPQIDLSLNPRFKQYEKMEIIPDSIVFFGPSNLLKSINSINTQKLSLQNIDSSIDTLINLIFPSNKFIGQHTKARLKIAIEEYTEGKISLPIQLDAGSKIRYKIFPAEAQITYQVALKDYSKINSNAFELSATTDSTASGKLLLHLSKQPKNIIVSNIQPATAEYIILR